MGHVTAIPGRGLGTALPVTVSDTVKNLRMDNMPARVLINEGTATATCPIDTTDSASSPAYTLSIPAGGSQELSPFVLRVKSTGSANAGSLLAAY